MPLTLPWNLHLVACSCLKALCWLTLILRVVKCQMNGRGGWPGLCWLTTFLKGQVGVHEAWGCVHLIFPTDHHHFWLPYHRVHPAHYHEQRRVKDSGGRQRAGPFHGLNPENWFPACKITFDDLKSALHNSAVLAHWDFDRLSIHSCFPWWSGSGLVPGAFGQGETAVYCFCK